MIYSIYSRIREQENFLFTLGLIALMYIKYKNTWNKLHMSLDEFDLFSTYLSNKAR